MALWYLARKIEECGKLRAAVLLKFPERDFGDIAFYRGCAYERNRDNSTSKISQSRFVEKIVDSFENTRTAHPRICCTWKYDAGGRRWTR